MLDCHDPFFRLKSAGDDIVVARFKHAFIAGVRPITVDRHPIQQAAHSPISRLQYSTQSDISSGLPVPAFVQMKGFAPAIDMVWQNIEYCLLIHTLLAS